MCEAGPSGAARLVTIKITVSAVAAAMTTNASMIPCVTAAPCTTLFNTAAPRVDADKGSPARAVAAHDEDKVLRLIRAAVPEFLFQGQASSGH